MVKGVLRELIRFFVDDGALALAIIGIVLLAAIASAFLPTIAAGTILSVGCPLALLLKHAGGGSKAPLRATVRLPSVRLSAVRRRLFRAAVSSAKLTKG